MDDKNNVIDVIDGLIMLKRFIPSTMWEPVNDAIASLKEQQQLIDEITQRRANNGAFD